MKECRRCHKVKPFDCFHKRSCNKDGLYSYCKPCAIADAQKWASSPERKAIKQDYDRERVQRLKDVLSAQARARYERNRDTIIARVKEYQGARPEQVRAIKQSYKHRRRAVERAGMTGKELADWKRAAPKVCHWCGVKVPKGFVVDHIQPLAKGGRHEARNLAISCRSCNASKAARDPITFAQENGRLL